MRMGKVDLFKRGLFNTLSAPWFKVVVVFLYCAIFIWYVLIGLYTLTQCALVENNTSSVERVHEKEEVMHVSQPKDLHVGSISTNSGAVYQDTDIKSYTRTAYGYLPYYMPGEGVFASPLTRGDVWSLVLPFMLILFMFNIFTLKLGSILSENKVLKILAGLIGLVNILYCIVVSWFVKGIFYGKTVEQYAMLVCLYMCVVPEVMLFLGVHKTGSSVR